MKTLFSIFFFLLLCSSFAQEVHVDLVQDGFIRPLNIQNSGDDRLFIVEQGGRIKIIQQDGSVNSIPFLDISQKVSNGNERGLLGLAFHPDFSNNGFFFVNYTDPNGDTQISRFTVNSTNPNLANPNSELSILSYTQPYPNHNGGAIAFGPDGYLYISSGDGGSSGDPDNNGQNLNVLWGKILRIDVDTFSNDNNYTIPADNPFVEIPNTRSEIWAYGLRNPWRFSFDETENNIWIADVGQADIEEINRQPLDVGGQNYGWRCYEGNIPFNTSGCPADSEMIFPFAEYEHINGNCSITGGFVYRGSTYSDIEGLYFFADFCSGMIGTVDNEGNLTNHGSFPGMWASFGEDSNKELYISDINGGGIYKIKGGEVAQTNNYDVKVSFSMIPNPTSSYVSLFLTQGNFDRIEIFDQRGRLIFKESDLSTNERQLAVSHFDYGIYFVKVSTDDGKSLTKKLIIQ